MANVGTPGFTSPKREPPAILPESSEEAQASWSWVTLLAPVNEKAPSGMELTQSEDLTAKVEISVSTNEAMVKALTDGSTESFWEGRYENSTPPSITLLFEKGTDVESVEIHIDNGRDKDYPVSELKLCLGVSEKFAESKDIVEIPSDFQGWVSMSTHGFTGPGVAVIHVKGKDNNSNMRVRLAQVRGKGASKAADLMLQDAHSALGKKALKVFRQLASQAFGEALDLEADVNEADSDEPEAPLER